MSFSNRLCNPTPFPCRYKYERGIVFNIPAFGEWELASVDQVQDFRTGQPGSEAVQAETSFHGLFLRDPNLSYDTQALRALKLCLKERSSQFAAGVDRIKNNLGAQRGSYDEKDLEEAIVRANFHSLRDQIKLLEAQIEVYASVVSSEETVSLHKQYDPERTVFVTEPPREFPSKTAMRFFLEQNPEILAKHEKFSAAASEHE